MIDERTFNAIRFSCGHVLAFWTDLADYNNDFTNEDLDDWMEAVIPMVLKLQGKAATIKNVKRLAKKTGQKNMGKDTMFKFLDIFNSELAKQGFVKQ